MIYKIKSGWIELESVDDIEKTRELIKKIINEGKEESPADKVGEIKEPSDIEKVGERKGDPDHFLKET